MSSTMKKGFRVQYAFIPPTGQQRSFMLNAAMEASFSGSDSLSNPPTPTSSPPLSPTLLTPMPMRHDLDMTEQIECVRRSRVETYKTALLADWKATCTNKQNHHRMLLALLAEAARYRAGIGHPFSADVLQAMKNAIGLDMEDNGQEADDHYAVVLSKMSQQRMFAPPKNGDRSSEAMGSFWDRAM